MQKPTRSEITEQISENSEKMHEQIEDLDTAAADSETVQGTLESLDRDSAGGTSDAAAEVQSAIERAQDVATEIFNQEDAELDDIQNEAEQYEGEIQERTEASQSDQERVSDAAGNIDRQETAGELEKARDAIASDIDFLEDQHEQAKSAREETERLQQDHGSRVKGRRG
jgi:hypothetical protein